MEWSTVQHLDLRHVGRGVNRRLQPHAATFHPTQALVAVAIGPSIIEFDAVTGSKLSTINIGGAVVRMGYSPTSGHSVIAILEDCTIRACDFDTEQTCVLHSPEKRSERITIDTEVHLALTPLQPVVFFGFNRRMSVTVVGTVEGGRAPTKIKTDLKKPIMNLACHPRLPVLYVAYADGLIRAYNIHTYAVNYTLQLDNTIKLIGAGAFAFHPTLEWIFVGDRRGTLLAWDVSTERPSMIGITQVGSQPITSISWLSMLKLLVTVSKDGTLHVWKTRLIVNPNRPLMPANFFEAAGIESIDIPRILSQQGGETNMAGADNMRNKAAYTREGRKQLFAVLQGARGSSASVLKEKLLSLGASGILADHQLQAQLQEHHLKGRHGQPTISDIARKAFLHSVCHSKSTPISRLPLISILDTKHYLKDVPVCQPFHLELNFFNKENRVLHYPVRAFYVEGLNLMAYNLCSGGDSIYKKLYASIPGNVEYHPKHMVYGKIQRLFLVVYEFSGSTTEVVLYWENTSYQAANSKGSTLKGRDAAFIGPKETQLAILDEDKTGLSLYVLPGGATKEGSDKDLLLEENPTAAEVTKDEGPLQGPMQFMFESEVDRIFSTPIESTLMYVSNGDQISLAKLVKGYRLSNSDGHYIQTKSEGRKSIKLKANELVLQVHWQETLRGFVAGILTTRRVLMVSADLEILASSTAKFDKGLPPFRSLLWVGPALLFSTTTAVSLLGWDGIVRTIFSISMPYAALVGALNDRLLLANPTDINPRQKKAIEIRSCLVGLLEPLLIGFSTMQQTFEQKLDLSEILYQITSRFDSLRITPRALDILARGPPVCGDLAVSLSQAGPQFTQVLRCIYAIKALRFSTALSVLKDEFLRSRDYPKCPPTSHLFHRFRQLGYACIRYGQFDSAKETFEVIADYESLLDLFICHLNPSAMRRLAQKLEEESVDPELRRYCERILRVRSTGWTQGIFANFAAESMVPKGAEWGGGNWEIKTPTNLKSIPQWELAGEVMPYMRSDEGTIPAIITDHIGVYLGSIKGRGNVVEVREDSLVKAYIPSGDNKTNGVPDSLAKSLSNNAKGQPDRKSNGGSFTSLEALTSQTAGSSAEQAKAEEEFKKTLYGTAGDGSSSDEEGSSKTKKLQIRIRDKPISSTTVDVNKIKEATKQLKLVDALGPTPRTRPLSGSQDFGQLLSQPPSAVSSAPAAAVGVSATTDLFSSFMQPPPVSQPTPTTAAAQPIPEDFFEHTISSIQVAKSLPPPGTYLSKMEQPFQGAESGERATPNPAGTPVPDIGFPGGGVPPQTTQQTFPTDSFGLPDGGVPPQVSSQPPIIPQVSGQHSQAPISSQPLDLSVLGVPNTDEPGKSPGPAPPSSVRPGQVPRGAAASMCFKTGLAHLEQNQLPDALSCFDEAFLALAKDFSRGADIKAQATICAQYKIAVTLLQEITRLQKVQGPNVLSAKDEMGRLSRHLGSLPLLAKHRINCIRTAIKRNMEVQNFAYGKQMLELLLSKAPQSKQDELRSLIDMCVQRGSTNKSIDPQEDPSQFCAATLGRLSTIGYDVCDLCGAKFSALSSPGCIICGMGSIKRSDAVTGPAPVPSPFG
ncbi:TSET complex member tstE [Linum perenne]